MPEFVFDGLTFQSPVELALHAIGGKWKMPILWRLNQRTWRYNALHRDLKRVSHKMLTQQLREMEADGLVLRKIYAEVPPRVEYALTRRGESLLPALDALRSWSEAELSVPLPDMPAPAPAT